MTGSPTQYDQVPQQSRSFGSCKILLPLCALVQAYTQYFARKTLCVVLAGRTLLNPDVELAQAGLSEDALSLGNWFDDCRPQKYSWNQQLRDLKRLAGAALELASDNGAWTSDAEILQEVDAEATEELIRLTQSFVDTVCRNYGQRAAGESLDVVRRRLDNNRRKLLKQVSVWPARASEELRKQAENLLRWAEPKSWAAKLILRFWSDCPFVGRLSDSICREVDRCVRQINGASTVRYEQLVVQAKLNVLNQLLGDAGRDGAIQRILAGLRNDQEKFLEILGGFHECYEPVASTSSSELLLVERLDEPLDPGSKTTFLHLMNTCVVKAGCTPEKLAHCIRQKGLRYRGAYFLPHEWNQLEPSVLAALLLKIVARFLGTDDPNVELNPQAPRTALDQMAKLDLQHPALRARLMRLVPALIARSCPYAIVEPLVGVKPVRLGYLFCAPSQRPMWNRLLMKDVQLSDAEAAGGYETNNPFSMQLLQIRLALPAGAMPSFWRWMSRGNRARRLNMASPHIDRRRFPEPRLLGERDRGHTACVRLLESAEKASLVHAIAGSGNLILNRRDPRLEELFAPSQYEPQWLPPESFHDLLKLNAGFVDFVERSIPTAGQFRQLAAVLAREHELSLVAAELVKAGVVKEQHGQLQINAAPVGPQCDIPVGLYRRVPGPLVGLSRDAFVAQLQRNDLLSNVLFWAVFDAFELGWLSENDTPEAVVEMSKSLA